MEQNKQKNLKRWMEQAANDFKAWLRNSNDNERKIIVATLLHIQELAQILNDFVTNGEELKKIENAVDNIYNSIPKKQAPK